MTEQDKRLLLKDLSARLPYGVKIFDIPANVDGELYLVSITDMVEYEPVDETDDDNWAQTLYNIKPYLRPMSSMTVEEEDEYQKCGYDDIAESGEILAPGHRVDFLNAHHFDFRGLIEKCLAIEAKPEMYKI